MKIIVVKDKCLEGIPETCPTHVSKKDKHQNE